MEIEPISSVPKKDDSAAYSQDHTASKVDSGASSIEKSKHVTPYLVPSVAIIPLAQPSSSEMFAVVSVNGVGDRSIDILVSSVDNVKQQVVSKWNENVQAIAEEVRALLRSPYYQQLQELQRQANQAIGNSISSVSSPSAEVGIVSQLNHLPHPEEISSNKKEKESTASEVANIIFPFAAGLIVGGTLGPLQLAHTQALNSNPFYKIVEMVEQLQPLFTTLQVKDVIPIINLMIITPIYYHSWNEAVSNFKHHAHDYSEMIHKFAQDVVNMRIDLSLLMNSVVDSQTQQKLPLEEKERFLRMAKVIVCGVALGLLYSVEVGKVQNGQFGGMEAEEFRELILGQFNMPQQAQTPHHKLVTNLLVQMQTELSLLPTTDRLKTAELLLNYLGATKELNPMLDPLNIFSKIIEASHYYPKEQFNRLKA